jgi:hypothetical protein
MDSNGNIHGTVDAGGHTYHVNNWKQRKCDFI